MTASFDAFGTPWLTESISAVFHATASPPVTRAMVGCWHTTASSATSGDLDRYTAADPTARETPSTVKNQIPPNRHQQPTTATSSNPRT
jgi:hypothetical protein